jgi:uncharacterized delta-60 repeat protein
MSDFLRVLRCMGGSFCIVLAACGGGGDDGGGGAPGTGTVVGAAGGTVAGPNGASVVIPPGALAQSTAIVVAQSSTGAPALPAGMAALGVMFAFTPHGTAFTAPVTITVPFDPALVPAGATPQLFKTNSQDQWEAVAGATFGSTSVTAAITGFSFVQVVANLPLQRNDPLRIWTFSTHPQSGLGLAPLPLPGGSGSQSGGTVEQIAEFGLTLFDQPVVGSAQTLPPDGQANGFVFSSANGVTYLVSAEAPYNAARPDALGPIGSRTQLKQFQSFVKRADNASLSFTLTNIDLVVQDFNTRADPSKLIYAEVQLAVGAYKTSGSYFFLRAAKASVRGRGSLYIPDARNESFSLAPLWDVTDFDMSITDVSFPVANGSCPGKQGQLKLKAPRTYTVDLSSVAVGETFTLRIDTYADALNRRGGESAGDCQASSARAFLRDPQQIGGTALAFTGLEPTNQPLLPPPPDDQVVVPVACTANPNVQAGVLQFSAPAYTIGEDSGAEQTVTVTRTGGSNGAVTAALTSSDGTAAAGTDYTAVRSTVFFADGDSQPRVVTVPITPNMIGGQFNRTLSLALTQPGNCAALGTQASTVVSIVDDDPVPPGFGMDFSFGTAGKATMPETGTPPRGFGGDQSAMALQADGKIVMAGGSGADFILARFNADGSLDTGFGIEGKVVTDMGSGNFEPEEALGVAVQADGKIVVVGHATIPTSPPAPRLPPTFALTRYDSSGNLDPSFGSGGRVSGNVNGRAHAVAIQPDGKIVVAGEFSFVSNVIGEGGDITVARFNTNGSLDLGFGGSGTGQVASDIGGRVNTARQVVLQPDGAIAVSGFIHTDVMRFTAAGFADNSFGGSGKLTITGSDVGQGLALQPDGKLVLVGTVLSTTSPATSRFLLRRLNADGTPDTGFGTGGSVDTALSVNVSAGGVALQADGRIVVVGSRALGANSNFVVARYAADGTLDTGFGVAGTLSIDFFQFTDIGENVLVQPDGKILVSGSAQRLVSEGYGLARINP